MARSITSGPNMQRESDEKRKKAMDAHSDDIWAYRGRIAIGGSQVNRSQVVKNRTIGAIVAMTASGKPLERTAHGVQCFGLAMEFGGSRQ